MNQIPSEGEDKRKEGGMNVTRAKLLEAIESYCDKCENLGLPDKVSEPNICKDCDLMRLEEIIRNKKDID